MKQIIIIILLVTIYMLIKKNSINEYFDNDHNTKTDYRKFKKTLNKYKGKKKYILVFSAGPTLKNFKKTDIPNYVWDDCYVIAVKNSINLLCKHNIIPDFLVTNFIGAANRINHDLIDKHKPLFIGLDAGEIPKLRKKVDFMISINWKENYMDNVARNIKDIEFKNKNNDNKIYTGWGHIMMELAIPLCLFLKPKNIITIGWDVTNSNDYWNSKKETFKVGINWSNENDIIKQFSVHLHKFLLDNYGITINKINNNSGIKIPLFKSMSNNS